MYLGKPEVNQLRVAVAGHHDVFRLQIAEHEVFGVHVAHPQHQIRDQKLRAHEDAALD